MLVSIYVPTRNRAKLCLRAVQSALAQTYKEIEVIVVNDGSTDESASLLEKVALGDRRLRVYNLTEPVGAPSARNFAIRSSRGDFLTGLDDDDLFTQERVEAFVRSWQSHAANGEVPSCLFSQDVFKYGDSESKTSKPAIVTAEDMFFANAIGSQIFAPRAYYFESGLFDEKMPAWQDLDFFLRMLINKGPGKLVDHFTYIYDASDRHDRISNNHLKVRAACQIMVQKYKNANGRLAAQFVIQMLKNYDLDVTIADLKSVGLAVLKPANAYVLLRSLARQRSKRARSVVLTRAESK